MRVIFLLCVVLIVSACDGNTPLMEASIDGSQERISSLLESGTDVNQKNNYGWTALSHAARNGRFEVAKFLIEKGADVNAVDETGWTPLIRAAQKGQTKVVKLLIESGADVNAANHDGWTALMWASLREKLKTVKYLVTVKGINLNHQSKDGRSAIMISITENNNDILIVLQDAGAKP